MSSSSPEPEVLRRVVAALEASDYAKASLLARAALNDGNEHPLLLNLRALWHEQEGRDREALSDLERARTLAPQDFGVLNALGLALSRQNRLLEAAHAFDAAIAAQPRIPAAHFNKGCALEAIGELDAARAAFEATLALDSNSAEPFARLASLAARRGDWPSARQHAARALALKPGEATAELALVTADLEERDFVPAERRIRALLDDPQLSPTDRYSAQGLLGDVLNNQGRFADAFAVYVQGNAEFRRFHDPRFAGQETALDAIRWLTDYYGRIDQIPRKASASDAAEKSPAANHVFLLGFPRSGTTLMEQALASRPDVVSMEEKEAFVDSGRVFLHDAEGLRRLDTVPADQLSSHRQAYWQRVREFGLDATGKIFIDKHPFGTLKLPLIAKLFPHAKILFALRDPRDVVLSCLRRRFRMSAYTYEMMSPQSAARFYDAYMNLAELYRLKLPLDLKYVRHEDVVDDFEGRLREICAFIGIGWADSMREFTQRAKSRTIATPSAVQISRGLNREGVAHWRNYETQLAPILPVLKPWVERFGYS
ncbi:MAG: sulfotransferase [Proteobacteria bacterium]|nr:sulfotransferase [Pseudomonadota bacterium]